MLLFYLVENMLWKIFIMSVVYQVKQSKAILSIEQNSSNLVQLAVMKYLLENNMLHGDCLTVTGKTLAENLATVEGLKEGQDIIKPLSQPVKSTGHLTILRGNMAPEVYNSRLLQKTLY